LCSTPWKSLIVKGIEEKDKPAWNRLLEKHQVNMRHAANELNFQVEENSTEALGLKQYLVKEFNNDDTRTFGICIGIKTRRKSEVFSSILVKRRPLLRFFGLEFFYVYDILCSKNFNPNERTGFVFSRNNPRFLLAEQLRRSVRAFYAHRASLPVFTAGKSARVEKKAEPPREFVFQCRHCLSVYDAVAGEPELDIAPGTPFASLPEDYSCSVCESPKDEFHQIEKNELGLKPV
jgi:rubredoxin